jgi:hypothetical protein
MEKNEWLDPNNSTGSKNQKGFDACLQQQIFLEESA